MSRHYKLNRLQSEVVQLRRKLSPMNPASDPMAVDALKAQKSATLARLKSSAKNNADFKRLLGEIEYEIACDDTIREHGDEMLASVEMFRMSSNGDKIDADTRDRVLAKVRGGAA